MTQDCGSGMNREALFWEIVRSAPFVEADEMLRLRRQDAMGQRVESMRRRDGIAEAEANLLLRKINDEMHRLNRINRDYEFQVAVMALFGEDAWERVKVWMMQNRAEVM